jgi:hypothetical protein
VLSDPGFKGDPCNPESPLFVDNTSFKFEVLETPESGNPLGEFVDFVYIYGFVYFAIKSDPWKIYKL